MFRWIYIDSNKEHLCKMNGISYFEIFGEDRLELPKKSKWYSKRKTFIFFQTKRTILRNAESHFSDGKQFV